MNYSAGSYGYVNTTKEMVFRVKDPISALTHFIGFVAAIFAMPILLTHAAMSGESFANLVCFSVFMLSMILLYGASTAYHSFNISTKANLILKKLDHCMIPVLIAGSYTPVCVITLDNSGLILLAVVWSLAIACVIAKLVWVTCPKCVSSVIYIAMGWSCVFAIPQLISVLSARGFGLILAGGVFYTIGGVVYALRIKVLEDKYKNFGAHEIFHILVMIGSLCHYLFMYSELVGFVG